MLKTTKSTEFVVGPKITNIEIDRNNVVSGDEIINQKNSRLEKNQAKTAKLKNLVRLKNHDFFLNFNNIKPGWVFLPLKLD